MRGISVSRLGVAVAFLVLVGACANPAVAPDTAKAPQTGLIVSGEGSVSVVPDVALVTLGVEVEAETLEPALSQANSRMAAALERLKALGVAEKDIRTLRLNVLPFRERPTPTLERRGFRVTNVARVKIRNLPKVGELVEAAVVAGANRVESIAFTVDEPKRFQEEAREKALRDAQAKADQLAALSGIKRGKPISISEGATRVPPPIPFGVAELGKGGDLGGEVPISPGETEIRVVVNVTYAIE